MLKKTFKKTKSMAFLIIVLCMLFAMTGCVEKDNLNNNLSTAESTSGNTEIIQETTEAPHEHIYVENVVEATCTNNGYTIYECECGHTYTDNETDLTSHSFVDYKSDNNAECDNDGTKTAKCEYCNATDTVMDENSALGHDMSEWEESDSNYRRRKCLREGCLYIEAEAHRYGDSTAATSEPVHNSSSTSSCEYGKEIDSHTH